MKIIKLTQILLIVLGLITDLKAEEISYNKRIFLDRSVLNPEDKIRVMIYTSKFSIFPQFNQSAVAIQTPVVQGADPITGLIGAIIGVAFINQANKSERDEAIAFNNSLNDALTNIDINKSLKQAVATALSKNTLFNNLETEDVSHINELSQPGLLIRIEENSILTLSTRVHFDAQLKALCMETSTKIWRKNQFKPIYYSDLTYSSGYLSESSKTDLKKRWVANNGELLKTKIIEGISEIAHMLANDLSDAHAIESDSAHPELIETLNTATNKKVKTTFYKIEEMPDRLIGRLGASDSSLLSSIPRANFSVVTP